MSDSLDTYKRFIDGIAGALRRSVTARRVEDWDMPETQKPYQVPADNPLHRLVPGLTPAQRAVLCELLQKEREAALHDLLIYLEPYRLTKEGVPLAVEPFGTEMRYDFVCRSAGDAWPPQQPVAALSRLMHDLSESHWHAGWMEGTEYTLWQAVTEGPMQWGAHFVSKESIAELRRLSDAAGGWILWSETKGEAQFVLMEEWLQLYSRSR